MTSQGKNGAGTNGEKKAGHKGKEKPAARPGYEPRHVKKGKGAGSGK
jgi:hypothetical protein